MDDLIKRQTSIPANLIMLSRFLRKKECSVTSKEQTDVLQAMEYIFPNNRENYVEILKACFCKNKYQFENFEDWFREYTFEMEQAVDSKTKPLPSEKSKPKKSTAPSIQALKDWLFQQKENQEEALAAYSDLNVLTQKDFADMNEDEVKEIEKLFQRLIRKVLRRKTRLRKIVKNKKHLDLKATIKKSVHYNGELAQLIYSEKKEKRNRLVLLCDVSRSMDVYSRFFIHLIYAFQNKYDRINTFVFSTALHDVSDLLDNHSFDEAFTLISERVPQWSGGTKIGYSLQSFYNDFAHATVDRKTVVMILSDGWDTGDSEQLQDAMQSIYHQARKVLWLNPLAGHPEFEPETVGMKAVLPYIHALHAAHNLVSLKKVFKEL